MSSPSSSSRGSVLASIVLPGLLLLGGCAFYLWYAFIGPGRYHEVERFREQLAKVPGVIQVEVHGHEDVGYEVDGFTLEIEGRGPLKLGYIDDPSSDQLEKIHINRIGGHVVTYVVEGYIGTYKSQTGEPTRSQGWGAGFTVGTKGAHSDLFPFALHSLTDVVERYDDICEVIATWPMQPDYAKLVDDEGVRWFYALSDPSRDDNWLRPDELEDPD